MVTSDVKFSKWICKICKICLILTIYNGHLRRCHDYKIMKGKKYQHHHRVEMYDISTYSSGDESAPIGQVGQIQHFKNDSRAQFTVCFQFVDTKVIVELVGSGVDSEKAVKIVPWPRGNVRVYARFELSGELKGCFVR